MLRMSALFLAPAALALAAGPKPAKPVARLFVQDLETSSLVWADARPREGKLSVDPFAPVPGFPKLDAAKQKLVQMRGAAGLLCVGVRDEEGGKFGSGFALVRAGVEKSEHGDHSHWGYKDPPELGEAKIDAAQGNPAHLYVYAGKFYIANDALNGFTRIDPNEGGKPTAKFIKGGGGHITLAAFADIVGYGTWIDGGGPNKGRVDVTPFGSSAPEPAYSFRLPTGVIHGAISCENKVFFAPAAGVCWVAGDADASTKAEEVKVNTIDLGKEGETPRRTGAFAALGRHVLFTTGKAEPALAILDAKADAPKPVFVKLAAKPGTSSTPPELVMSAGGKPFAFVFHDAVKDSDAGDSLEIISLDPNGDGDFADAASLKVLAVGKSKVEGHSGHHAAASDADGRYLFLHEPRRRHGFGPNSENDGIGRLVQSWGHAGGDLGVRRRGRGRLSGLAPTARSRRLFGISPARTGAENRCECFTPFWPASGWLPPHIPPTPRLTRSRPARSTPRPATP